MQATYPTSAEPLLLIYRFDLSAPDGTSVQLRRMLEGFDRPVVHVFQVPASPRHATFAPPGFGKILFADPNWPFRHGGRFVGRWWHRFMSQGALRREFRRLAKPEWTNDSVAYVVVLDEEGAVFARRVLNALQPRAYALHLMDLFHEDGLNPATQPTLARLVKEATHVRCVCPALAREAQRLRTDPCEIAALLSSREVHNEPVSRSSRTAIMGGSLYASAPRKLGFFRDTFFPAWRELRTTIPVANLAYAGVDHAAFPSDAKPSIQDLGNLGDKDYYHHLRSARIAVLPISHHCDEVFRFSVVSRLVDYFAAGLPVIADRSPGTGTGEFLAQFEGKGAILVESKDEALFALKRFFLDDEFHQDQSRAALQLASRLTSPAALRAHFREMIEKL